MILLADSGSTKTDWRVMHQNIVVAEFKTIGLNPYFTSSEAVSHSLEVGLPADIDRNEIHEIHFYGAGCSSQTNKNIIDKGLKSVFPDAKANIEHDLLAAARALFGNQSGIACILGTGSNSCVYDGKQVVQNIYSLGYLFGDEGSGACLGKSFITLYLKNKLPAPISKDFVQTYSLSHDDILTQVYKNPDPNRFLATFAFFLKKHITHPYISLLVEKAFEEYFREQVIVYDDFKELPVSFIGSVACNFSEQLRKAAARFDIFIETFMLSPMEGLIEYHKQKAGS
jgi:glucosamine kinase